MKVASPRIATARSCEARQRAAENSSTNERTRTAPERRSGQVVPLRQPVASAPALQ